MRSKILKTRGLHRGLHKSKFELGSFGRAGGFILPQILIQQNTPERLIPPAGEIKRGILFVAGLQDESVTRKSGDNSIGGTIRQLKPQFFSIGRHKFRRTIIPFTLMFNANAKKAGAVNTFFVQVILPFCYYTQLASSVVERVPVFMVNNLAFLCVGYEMREQDRSFSENNDGITIRRNTHGSDIAIVFPVGRVAMNVKDFIINIRVNFDNPALDSKRQVIDFALL